MQFRRLAQRPAETPRRALIARTLIADALNDRRAGCIGLSSRQYRCSSHKRFGALAISE